VTREEIKALKAGIRVTLWDADSTGKARLRTGEIIEIIEHRDRPSYPSDRPAWVIAQVRLISGQHTRMVLESDDYITGMGYDTHVVDMTRASGRRRVCGVKLARGMT